MPVFQGTVAQTDAEADVLVPYDWDICETCGSAQLRENPPLELVYLHGHASGLGGVWERHHNALAKFILKNREARQEGIIDVGGGAGGLARAFNKICSSARWHILEPKPVSIPNDLESVSIKIGFFGDNKLDLAGIDTIVFSHCFEHLYHPREALAEISDKLPRDGLVILAWPKLELWLEDKQAGAINLEHSYFCDLESLVKLFGSFGLSLVASEFFPENRTEFLAFKKDGTPSQIEYSSENVARNGRLVRDFFDYFKSSAKKINALIAKGEGPVYLCPASFYSQTLVYFGLETGAIRGVLDNAPSKIGQRLYGTRLPVLEPGILTADPHPVIFINGGAHTNSLAQQFKGINAASVVYDIQSL